MYKYSAIPKCDDSVRGLYRLNIERSPKSSAIMLTLAASLAFLQGGTQFRELSIPQGTESLTARIYAPDPLPGKPQPAIVLLPGGGADISSVTWGGEGLAANGYVCVIVKPLRGGSAASYCEAARSAMDFLATDANPFRTVTDLAKIGSAGWSLGARSLTLLQEQDPRVKAIVGWDNLAAVETGDLGSPSGGFNPDPSTYRKPRVPAMGMASDATGFSSEPEIKKTAFEWWRASGQPTMQLVFESSNHFWWSGRSSTRQRAFTIYFTALWFDRWLRGDRGATGGLMSTNPLGTPITELLSDSYTSAASFDGILLVDLRRGK